MKTTKHPEDFQLMKQMPRSISSNTLNKIQKVFGIAMLIMAISISSGMAQSKYITVNGQKQSQTNWCWAAASSTISFSYLACGKKQCTIVQKAKDLGYVVANPPTTISVCSSPGNYNNGMYLDKVSTILNQLGLANTYYSSGLSFTTIKAALDANKLLMIWFYTSSVTTHAVVVRGYSVAGSTQYVYYWDTWDGTYKSGVWNTMQIITGANYIQMNAAVVRQSGFPTCVNRMGTDSTIEASETTSIEYDEMKSNINERGIQVFPSPSFGLITVSTQFSEGAKINVYNLLGEHVYSKTIATDNINYVDIDLTSLPEGMYVISVINKGVILNKRVLIR